MKQFGINSARLGQPKVLHLRIRIKDYDDNDGGSGSESLLNKDMGLILQEIS
jgi:hypothetical protein